MVLGGTFDHLHAGHKALLSLAAMCTSEALVIGITSPEMLKHKENYALIETLETRVAGVMEFIKFFKPSLKVEISPLTDPFGVMFLEL